MKQETINKRINSALARFIPCEAESVKEYIRGVILDTFENLEMESEIDNRTGLPYSSRNLAFAISITLDDVDTPMILREARKRWVELIY